MKKKRVGENNVHAFFLSLIKVHEKKKKEIPRRYRRKVSESERAERRGFLFRSGRRAHPICIRLYWKFVYVYIRGGGYRSNLYTRCDEGQQKKFFLMDYIQVSRYTSYVAVSSTAHRVQWNLNLYWIGNKNIYKHAVIGYGLQSVSLDKNV